MSVARNRVFASLGATLFAVVVSMSLQATSVMSQDESVCPLEPVTLPLFNATPAEVIAATPPVSTDAPEPTEEEIRAAAEIIVACSSASEQALRYAVFTDRILANQFIGENPSDQPAFERRIATGAIPDEWTFELEDISDIEQLSEGRVAVTLHISSTEETVTDRAVLAWDDETDAWLIDGFEWVGSPPTPED